MCLLVRNQEIFRMGNASTRVLDRPNCDSINLFSIHFIEINRNIPSGGVMRLHRVSFMHKNEIDLDLKIERLSLI